MIIRDENKFVYIILLFLTVITCETNTSELPRPRGVSITRAPLYAPGKDFVCLDHKLTIPYNHINDDYCDCIDGSDEPGTSACPNGIFHCTNAGHRSRNIPSSRVNDGICDCCDASDEYANPNSKCIDTCFELGHSARVAAQRQAELLKVGKEKRVELCQKGQVLKQEKKERLQQLEINKSEAERVKNEKEQLKNEAEELENSALEYYRRIEAEALQKKQEEEALATKKEATEQFLRLDSNQDGFIQIAELQVRQALDKDRNGEVSEDEAKFFLDEHAELNLDDFINVAWPKIKPFLMMESGMFKPPNDNADASEIEDLDQEDLPEEQIDDQNDEQDTDDDDAEENVDENVDENVEDDVNENLMENKVYDEETQKLVDLATEARTEFTEAERSVQNIQSEIKDLEEYLNKDYGPEEEFASLHGECFEFRDREYLYKLCPFDKVTQQPKSGGMETRLGVWSNWSGPEVNIYEQMMYERGASCWNGPQRSTKVHIVCGIENQITSVTEPNRCEYEVHFITPAACSDYYKDQSSQNTHDEL